MNYQHNRPAKRPNNRNRDKIAYNRKVKKIWLIVSLCLFIFTVAGVIVGYSLLIEKDEVPYYEQVADKQENAPKPNSTPPPEETTGLPPDNTQIPATDTDIYEPPLLTEPIITDEGYKSNDIDIKINKITDTEADLTYFVADIKLKNVSNLKTAFAKGKFGQNIRETTSKQAEDNHAIVAVNGDYYGFKSSGVVIRNGQAYRNKPTEEICAIFADGTMKVFKADETDADKLLEEGCVQAFSFGPILIRDGQVYDTFPDLNPKNPRCGIGYIEPNHFVFVVVDGRQPGYSNGITLKDYAKLFESLGCTQAYNLDGGGTATFWYNGSVLSKPSYGEQRTISDIIYIGEN